MRGIRRGFDFIVVAIAMLLLPVFLAGEVMAHPGRTDANGGHTCRTNCEKYGLQYGEYHYHNGGSSSGSSSSSSGGRTNGGSNGSSSTYNQGYTYGAASAATKSSNSNLKSVKVNEEDVVVADRMNYETFEEKVDIAAEVEDDKASYEVENKSLEIGENVVAIKVTAENGTVKTYELVVMRKKLSNNTNLKVFVDGEEVDFVDSAATIEVGADVTKVNYEYELEDENARVEIRGDEELEEGDNVIELIVTAQDGTVKTYVLTVHKEASGNVLAGALAIGAAGVATYGVYGNYTKKGKKNK